MTVLCRHGLKSTAHTQPRHPRQRDGGALCGRPLGDGSSYFPISQSMVRSMAREQTGQNRSMFRVNMMQSVVGR